MQGRVDESDPHGRMQEGVAKEVQVSSCSPITCEAWVAEKVRRRFRKKVCNMWNKEDGDFMIKFGPHRKL